VFGVRGGVLLFHQIDNGEETASAALRHEASANAAHSRLCVAAANGTGWPATLCGFGLFRKRGRYRFGGNGYFNRRGKLRFRLRIGE
jgi:hypothetical protein